MCFVSGTHHARETKPVKLDERTLFVASELWETFSWSRRTSLEVSLPPCFPRGSVGDDDVNSSGLFSSARFSRCISPRL